MACWPHLSSRRLIQSQVLEMRPVEAAVGAPDELDMVRGVKMFAYTGTYMLMALAEVQVVL